jgi:hypothetical protein
MRRLSLALAWALFSACSDAAEYRVVIGPVDAYDLSVVEGDIIARGVDGTSRVRLSGGSAIATPLQSLELGHGARLNLPQRVFVSESGTTVPLAWHAEGAVLGVRVGSTCVVAFDGGSADTPTHELAFLSCRDGQIATSSTSDLRAVDVVAIGAEAVLIARRGDGVARLEVLDIANGRARWSHDAKPGTGDPTVVGDEAFVVEGADKIVAFRLGDGSRRELKVRLDDGYSISAIGSTDHAGQLAMASCLCVQAGAVVESNISFVSSKDATSKPLAKLPKAFSALDVLVRGKQVLVVGYTNAPSKPQPSDLDLAPK